MKKIKFAVPVFFATGIFGFSVGGIIIWKTFKEVIRNNKSETKKLLGYYFLLNQWIVLKQNKKSIVKFFERNNYRNVAIYGMGELGKRLLLELESAEVHIECIIDQNIVDIDTNIPILHPDELIPAVDVIVVAASYYFNEIKTKLIEKVCGDIIPIEDIIYSKY